MKLGLVEQHMADAGGHAGELVGEAHEQARLALTTLRDQIRGIHPQILTDLGPPEMDWERDDSLLAHTESLDWRQRYQATVMAPL
jgi:hypothetical protein